MAGKKKATEVAEKTNVPPMMEIIAEARAQNQALIDNLGELNEDLEKQMEITKENFAKKTDGYYFRWQDLEGHLEILKTIKKQADSGMKVINRSLQFLETRMISVMGELQTKQILGNYSKFSLIKTKKKVEIEDESILPAEYTRETITVEIDKQKIYDDLTAGKVVPGAKLVENEYLKPQGNNLKTVKDATPQIEGGSNV